jgi:hypothetical protein
MNSPQNASRSTRSKIPFHEASPKSAELELAAALRVIALLEDRQVLYEQGQIEVPSRFVQSVLEIMHCLSDESAMLDHDSKLARNLRAMRAACRKFLDCVWADGHEVVQYANVQDHSASGTFYTELGELRRAFGIYVAEIAAQFKLEIEDRLASILPASAEK